MNEAINFELTPEDSGERLDKIIVARLGDQLTRNQIQTLIQNGDITVNGKAIKSGVRLKGTETIQVIMPAPIEAPEPVKPEPITLNILHEDPDFAIIDKPAGLVVHPGIGNQDGTLVNAILNQYPEIAEIEFAPHRKGIVHRLDKDTSGLILIARNTHALQQLAKQFQRRTVDKIYLALVERAPKTPTGRIDVPIARDTVNRRRMMASRTGKPAVSEFEVVERFKSDHALIRVRLLTGRTHQIRVHMAFVDAMLVGDPLYGYRRQRLGLRRQFLHAAQLCFDHPRTGERLCFESPLPQELQDVLAELRR